MGAVVVLAVIGVIFLIVVGAVCGVRKRRQNTVNKPAHGTFGECSVNKGLIFLPKIRPISHVHTFPS